MFETMLKGEMNHHLGYSPMIKGIRTQIIEKTVMEGKKDILSLWLNETESKHKWIQILDEIKAREVEDII